MKNKHPTYKQLVKKYHKQKVKLAQLEKHNQLLSESAWALKEKIKGIKQALNQSEVLCAQANDQNIYLTVQVLAYKDALQELGVIDGRSDETVVQEYLSKARQKRHESQGLRAKQQPQIQENF